jgi:hypothetical protein
MNRKNLTAAVLAGLAGFAGIVGSAQAVNVNPDGLGQVLLFPYYTVNGDNLTLLSVVNTTDEAKAVKVRFLEGQNSQEVLDFNLYMSAYDVWSAAVLNDSGVPVLSVQDTTCTVPYLYMADIDGDGVRDGLTEFLPWQLNDGGLFNISRAREGHFEMIEMGVLTNEDEDSAWAATHAKSGANAGVPPKTWIPSVSAAMFAATGDAIYSAPRVCGQLVDAWTDPDDSTFGDEGYWVNSPTTDIDTPIGGLFGGAAVINPLGGAMYSYNAKAINGFSESIWDGAFPVGVAPLHTTPGRLTPSLNSGDVMLATVFSDQGTLVQGVMDRGVDAVSYVLMHDQLMNEYTTEAGVAAETEWVVTFPTKAYYVYDPNTPGGDSAPLQPFTSYWNDKANGTAKACEVVALDKLWDREELTPESSGRPIPPTVSPAPPVVIPGVQAFQLCYETSVIRFGSVAGVGSSTEILGSTNFHNIDNVINGYEYGWASIQLADYPQTDASGNIIPGGATLTRSLTPVEGRILEGLPVTGFAVERFGNSFAGNGAQIATYGGIFEHRSTRSLGSLIP